MPELPEVELVATSLNSLVKGFTIASARLFRERLAPDISPEDFAINLGNAKINYVHRRGKHILFDLDNSKTLITHLRMSGRFSLLRAGQDDPKFTHAAFYFEDEIRLVFDDQRHFGLMKIVETARLNEAKELAKLAPEPFSDEFSISYFRNTLAASKRSLKEFLLDQTKVCGLGNIYASEAMFAARVNPQIPAHELSTAKTKRLFESIRVVLDEAIKHGQRSIVDPENLEGGYFRGEGTRGWRVYDREKEPCMYCNSPIVRLKQGGRSTYFCVRCQRK